MGYEFNLLNPKTQKQDLFQLLFVLNSHYKHTQHAVYMCHVYALHTPSAYTNFFKKVNMTKKKGIESGLDVVIHGVNEITFYSIFVKHHTVSKKVIFFSANNILVLSLERMNHPN